MKNYFLKIKDNTLRFFRYFFKKIYYLIFLFFIMECVLFLLLFSKYFLNLKSKPIPSHFVNINTESINTFFKIIDKKNKNLESINSLDILDPFSIPSDFSLQNK